MRYGHDGPLAVPGGQSQVGLATMGLAATATSGRREADVVRAAQKRAARGRSGLDSEISNLAVAAAGCDDAQRYAGTVTVSVRRNGRGPSTRTRRSVCLPGGTCIRTTPPVGGVASGGRARTGHREMAAGDLAAGLPLPGSQPYGHGVRRWRQRPPGGAPDATIAARWLRPATTKPITTSSHPAWPGH